jgi:hypothetical protein
MVGSSIVVQYSAGHIINLHGRITSREYVDMLGNQVYPMIRTLYPSSDVVFQDDSTPIHTAETVQSWFEEHEGELRHLSWPAQPADLNIIESPWSVLETRMRNRFPPPTSLKQLEDVFQEEWYKVLLETVQNLYRVHSKKDCGCIEVKRWSNTILVYNVYNIYSVSIILFKPSPKT